MPIVLPRVDYVMVGRDEAGTKRYGLATWPHVLEVIRSAGIDSDGNPVDIRYDFTPDAIEQWFARIPEVDTNTLPRLSFDHIIDDEVLAAAAAMRTNR